MGIYYINYHHFIINFSSLHFQRWRKFSEYLEARHTKKRLLPKTLSNLETDH